MPQGNPRDKDRGIGAARLRILTKLAGLRTTREKRLRLAEIRASLASELDACNEVQRDLLKEDND